MGTARSILLLPAACLLAGSMHCASDFARPLVQERVQSVTLDARRKPPDSLLPELADMGVTHLTLVSFAYQASIDEPYLRVQPNGNWYSESDRGITALAKRADSLGMHVILKPHIWVGRYSSEGQTRAHIGFESEEAWEAWEAQYRAYVMHYAQLAARVGAPMLVVGTELHRPARERPEYWRALIAEVREVYPGQLTYAANWWEEYEDVTFWEDLDYIGIQGYFELSKDADPSREALVQGWAPYKETMQSLSAYTGRPVLFTELGYRNVPDAAAKPWRWPSRSDAALQPADELQVRLYDVFFESLWDEPWFAGVILWKWAPQPGRRSSMGFSPQGKPAESVIADWFTKESN